MDGDGRGIATWVVVPGDITDAEVVIAEELDLGWGPRRPGDALGGHGLQPTLAVGLGRRALATWSQVGPGGSAVVLAERDAEGRWTPTAVISTPPTASDPRVGLGPADDALLAWSQGDADGQRHVAVAQQLPEDPAAPLRSVTPDPAPPVGSVVHRPALAQAGNGDALIVWQQNGDGGPALAAVARFRLAGTFAVPDDPAVLSPPAGPDPVIEFDPATLLYDSGEALVLWAQPDGTGAAPLYLARFDGMWTWTVPADAADTFSTPSGRAATPVAILSAGEAHVAWSHDDGSGPEIRTAHRQPDGAWDVEGRDALTVSTAGAEAIEPRLAAGPDGEVVLVWTERVHGRWRVVARRRQAAVMGWGDLEPLSTGPDDAVSPSVSIGPAGRVIAGWVQGPAAAGRVTFARIE